MRSLRRLFLNHWRAKLGSLVLATILWLVIKRGINYSPTLPPPETPPAVAAPARD